MEVRTNAKVYFAWTLFVHIYSQFNFCHLRLQNAKNGKEEKLEKEIGVGRDLFQKLPNFKVQSNIRPNVFDILV